jgi:hypothetical protein
MYVPMSRVLVCALGAFIAFNFAVAGDSVRKPAKAVAPVDTVALFDGIESGDLEVKVIPKDSTTGTVLVANKTGKPLKIALPPALAAVPALAQFDAGMGMGGGDDGGYGGGGGGGNQGMGGGMMGGMGGMMGGMGGMGGGGMFNVPAGKVSKVRLVTVCLEHGKKDPNPRVPYKLVPVESFAKDAAVCELLKMLVRGQIDQHSAQAAAWHLQNGLSWEQLAKKVGAKHIGGRTEPYFTAIQLRRAHAAVKMASDRAEKAAGQEKSPGQSLQ